MPRAGENVEDWRQELEWDDFTIIPRKPNKKEIQSVLSVAFELLDIKDRRDLNALQSTRDMVIKIVKLILPEIENITYKSTKKGWQAAIRWAYQEMLPGYSIWKRDKFPDRRDEDIEGEVIVWGV